MAYAFMTTRVAETVTSASYEEQVEMARRLCKSPYPVTYKPELYWEMPLSETTSAGPLPGLPPMLREFLKLYFYYMCKNSMEIIGLFRCF